MLNAILSLNGDLRSPAPDPCDGGDAREKIRDVPFNLPLPDILSAAGISAWSLRRASHEIGEAIAAAYKNRYVILIRPECLAETGCSTPSPVSALRPFSVCYERNWRRPVITRTMRYGRLRQVSGTKCWSQTSASLQRSSMWPVTCRVTSTCWAMILRRRRSALALPQDGRKNRLS